MYSYIHTYTSRNPIREAVVETLTHMIARIDGTNELNAIRNLITKWKQPINKTSSSPPHAAIQASSSSSSSSSVDIMKSIDFLSSKSRTPGMETHTHTYIYITNIHIYRHTYYHTLIHTHIHTYINSHIHTLIHTLMYARCHYAT